MKKAFWIFIAFLIVDALVFPACNNAVKTNVSTTASHEDLYTCSMHPQIVEDHPGDCPICGMDLIKKNATPVVLNNVELETLLKPTNEFVVAALPVTTPGENNVSIPLKAYGTIESDTRAAGTVSARVSGRIEKLYLRYRFQKIQSGQKVAEIYSPELVTAQQNLLFLLKNDAQNTSFISAAKQKLALLGMSAPELNKLLRTGKPLYSVSIYSNYTGHVHDAGMAGNRNGDNMSETGVNAVSPVTQELSLKEGMYVNKGQTLFMIMNHHKVWAALQVFPEGQSIIRNGDAVKIVPETDTSAIINGRIDFIEPFFRNNRKTLTARVNFNNMEMLPIGSQVVASIYTRGQQGLWLPQTAVLSLGMNDVVFMKSAGGFMAHKVTTGLRSGEKIQILEGLNAIDTVALNAEYLIDSESLIKTNQ